MIFFLIGLAILASVVAIFYFKGRLASPRLGRLAYSEPIMRLVVIAAALIVIGILQMLSKLFS